MRFNTVALIVCSLIVCALAAVCLADETAQLQDKKTHQVRGLSGSGRLELPCLVDQLNCGEVYYITWTKSSSNSSSSSSSQQQQWQRVYLYTGANDSSPHKPIGELANRAQFHMPAEGSGHKDGDESAGSGLEPPMARLVIEQPRLSDEALYKCDVTYVKGKCPSISLVRVQMMALPSKAQISFVPSGGGGGGGGVATTNQLDDGQLIGPLNEHEQLRLICRVFGGRPQPKSIIWRKIDPSGRRINLQHEQSRPAIRIAGDGGNGNGNGEQQHHVEVHLNHTLTSADLGAKLECHIEHEALDEPALPTGRRYPSASQAQQPDSLLDLHPSRPASEADDDQTGQTTNSKQSLDAYVFVDLNVGVASLDLFMSRVNKGNSSEPMKEGDLVELECVAYNSKPPANISWFNGDEPIEQLIDSQPASSQTHTTHTNARSQRQRRLLQRNQVNRNNDGQTYNTHSFLSIKLSRHEHRAEISCKAHQNSHDGPTMLKPVSKKLELLVQHAPIVLMEPAGGLSVNEHHHRHDQVAAKGSENNVIGQPAEAPVSIYCIYSANPSELTPNSTRWFKDGQQLQTQFHQDSSQHQQDSAPHLSESLTATGYPVLNINRVSRRDAGRYDCQLANSVGTSERLPSSEATLLEVNFRPSVRLRLFKPTRSTESMFHQASFQLDELAEIDPADELILIGQTYVLVCDVLGARPSKIEKFHWFRKSFSQQQQQQQTTPYQLIGVSEASQFVLSSLAANFSPAYYTCAALNALGSSDNSNQLELQLSYSPGPSVVRPVRGAALRKQLLQSGEQIARPAIDASESSIDPHSLAAPLAAGQKILLECATQDPGQPRANAWLWFKNGQPIDSKSLILANNNDSSNPSIASNNNNNVRDLILDDNNPISGLDQAHANGVAQRRNQHTSSRNEIVPSLVAQVLHENQETDRTTISGSDRELDLSEKMKLLGSGRYLFIPSIQLVHKGNYSCVALNHFGSGPQRQQQSTSSLNRMERDSYNLNVALAPSFVQPLPPRTYWPEISSPPPTPIGAKPSSSDGQMIMELVCHVQCDPMCNIEWFRNGQPIDLKGKWHEQEESGGGPNYVSHQIRQSILDENLEANLFKSIESRLSLRIQPHMGGEQLAMFARERVLARRSYLNGSNYTCQSTTNSMGPAVRSTSKFVVQYPPENVLINAPSDKLSLVEGSNGPRLSCEASGEPQVQYRWLLSKSSGSDLLTSKYNNQVKRSSPMAFSSVGTGGSNSNNMGPNEQAASEQDHAINQPAPSAMGLIEAPPRGANDVSAGHLQAEENLVELAGSISEQRGGVTISTLDLSQLSLDRKQSGHYICEASNKLGQTRQSVYVNVLYKPTCSGLHLHSLDMLMAPPNANDIKQSEVRVKPLRASSNDEYTLVRENSDDFIKLRKTLVILPLLNGHLNTGNTHDGEPEFGELSLQNSVFDDKKFASTSNGLGKDKDALIHTDDTDMSGENNALPSHGDFKQPRNQDNSLPGMRSKGDTWSRFNALLLNFLNTYVRQVKEHEDSLIESPRKESSRDKRQNPRGSSRSADTTDRLSRGGDFGSNNHQLYQNGLETTATKNLLTFACMAQDGNPMGNLSFDWSFGSISLPESSSDFLDLESSQAADGARYGLAAISKPAQLIYVNANRTVGVMLVRRLDTHTALSPFQMSLLTLNVVIDQQQLHSSLAETPEGSKISKRNVETVYNPVNERYSPQAKAPVIRSRPYNGNNNNNPRVNQNHGQQQQNSNIQFANEFEAKPALSTSYQVELDEYNWQEKLGALLNCRVSNQIGTSDVCHVRVNLAERLKSLSSSESEFAKWRMPSLGQKSLLIVSLLVGFALIVFFASALLIGPYLRGLSYKSSETVHESGENNTRQSTSSQKSSVLGLLTNGDSSLQGSSDEDSNGRSNHMNDNGLHTDSLQPLDLGGSSLSGIVSSCGYHTTSAGGHNHYQSGQLMIRDAENLMANYDKPRRLQDHPATYQNSAFSEQTPDRASGNASHYLESLALNGDNNNKVKQHQRGSSANLANPSNRINNRPSAGSKLLASLKLKSLSKFKVDKISDQASLASHLADLKSYHTRSTSGSGTNTTGMSNLCLDSDLSLSLTPPNASGSVAKYFGSPAFRHSYTNVRRTANHHQADNPTHRRYNRSGPQPSMHNLHLAQIYAESQAVASMVPTYSNLNNYEPYNAMDEFIRRKELESSLELGGSEFARSQSIKYRGQAALAPPPPQPPNQHDLNNLYSPQMVRQQPYYFSGQPQSMTLQRSNRMTDHRPPVAARPPRRVINQDPAASMQQYQMPANNRYSMPSSAQIPMINSSIATANTIDSHLDNFASTLAAGHYPNSARFAPPVSSNEMRQLAQNIYGNSHQQDQRSTEHIYDVNAYATPEQTPQRGQTNIVGNNNAQDVTAPRSRVGQLIQTFNSSLQEE